MLEDGSVPSEPITIERLCGASTPTEGYTDSKGYFGIQLGNEQGVFQDATQSGSPSGFGQPGYQGGSMGSMGGSMSSMGTSGMGGSRYMNCELRAKLAGFRSQTVSLATRRPMDPPDIGTILLHRIAPTEGSVISAVSLRAPKDARKAFDKGQDALKKHKTDDAEADFQKATAAYPEYATAWYELGKIQLGKGQAGDARKSFDAALEADPKFVNPYLEISLMALQAHKWDELADVTNRAVQLDPFDYPQAFFFNAVANYNLQHIDAAEKSAREAQRLDTRHQYPKTDQLMGVILAQKQDYTGAAEQLKNYLRFSPGASDAPSVRTQLEQIEKLTAQNPPAPPAPPKQDK
jgi:tetratricopeptide (TPR) repeat protein